MYHINIIAIKNIIILKKARKKEKLLECIADIIIVAKVTHALSLIDLAWRYKWVMSNADLNTVKKLELTRVKKY